jgi:hypothetical protein
MTNPKIKPDVGLKLREVAKKLKEMGITPESLKENREALTKELEAAGLLERPTWFSAVRRASVLINLTIHATLTVTLSSGEQLPKPPALGEALLILFCPKNRARHVMGCLEENFHGDIKAKGKSRAKLLYWAAVLESIGPLLWVKLRRAGFIALVLEIGRRWSGLS